MFKALGSSEQDTNKWNLGMHKKEQEQWDLFQEGKVSSSYKNQFNTTP